MIWVVVLLLAGLTTLILGGSLFVRAAVGIAEILRLPHVVIGGTLMSIATTSPEIAVSIASGLAREPGLAVGNALGSILCNIGLIGGVMALIRAVAVRREDFVLPLTVLGALALAMLVMSFNGVVGRLEAGALVAAGVGYFVIDLVRSLRGRTDVKEAWAEAVDAAHQPPRSALGNFGLFAVGAAMVVGGCHLLVTNAVILANSLGVPSVVIGLTVVAVGTSLPEFVTAVTAARQGVSDLSVGNLIGANIANLTLVAGSAGLFAPITVSRQDYLLNFPALLAIVGLFAFWILVRNRISRLGGGVLLALYAAYVVTLCVWTLVESRA